MAYFPNGSAGVNFDNECVDCLHDDLNSGCPIAYVQMTFNYDQAKNEKLAACLSALVDQKKGCRLRPIIMRLKGSPKPDTETMDIFDKNSLFSQASKSKKG